MFGAHTKDEFFFRALLDHAKKTVECSLLVKELFKDGANVEGLIASINQLEHDADDIVRSIVRELRETWILPLDREDIRQLATSLDNIIDAMEALAHRMSMFELGGSRAFVPELCGVLIAACEKVCQAIALLPGFKKPDELLTLCREVDKLEVDADRLYRSGLAALYKESKDPIDIMKWSHIYEYLETATDATNDVVDLIEGIVLEYA